MLVVVVLVTVVACAAAPEGGSVDPDPAVVSDEPIAPGVKADLGTGSPVVDPARDTFPVLLGWVDRTETVFTLV